MMFSNNKQCIILYRSKKFAKKPLDCARDGSAASLNILIFQSLNFSATVMAAASFFPLKNFWLKQN